MHAAHSWAPPAELGCSWLRHKRSPGGRERTWLRYGGGFVTEGRPLQFLAQGAPAALGLKTLQRGLHAQVGGGAGAGAGAGLRSRGRP